MRSPLAPHFIRKEYKVNRHSQILNFAGAAALSMMASPPASAQSMKDQIVGTWSVESNVEHYADGKSVSWGQTLKGLQIFDAGGRFVLMEAEVGSRSKADGNPALNPVGKMVSYFGTYAVNETEKTLTYQIVGASFPNWDGSEQKRVVATLDASKLVYKTAAPIPSPQGPFVPVVTWTKLK